MNIPDTIAPELIRRCHMYMQARARRDTMSDRATLTPTVERAAALEAAQRVLNQVAIELAELTCAMILHEERS